MNSRENSPILVGVLGRATLDIHPGPDSFLIRAFIEGGTLHGEGELRAGVEVGVGGGASGVSAHRRGSYPLEGRLAGR